MTMILARAAALAALFGFLLAVAPIAMADPPPKCHGSDYCQ